ncbi:MAG: metallophosphoesterase family protein [Chloroflexi bacterium]|nr:metallophosphoesterase family protein [Chloroflexota bacterium]
MRIGLVSDTHVPVAARALPAELMKALEGVDLIMHGGDIYNLSVLDDLQKVAPVLAARGDDDYVDCLKDQRVKEKHILKLGGQTIWLVHERPYYLNFQRWDSAEPAGSEERPESLNFQRSESVIPFIPSKDEKPDIVFFGHEHRVVVEQVYDILFVSPGSPTFLHYQRGLGTAAIVDLDSGKPDVRILQL